MLPVEITAIALRINLPLSLAVVWVVNPTRPPVPNAVYLVHLWTRHHAADVLF